MQHLSCPLYFLFLISFFLLLFLPPIFPLFQNAYFSFTLLTLFSFHSILFSFIYNCTTYVAILFSLHVSLFHHTHLFVRSKFNDIFYQLINIYINTLLINLNIHINLVINTDKVKWFLPHITHTVWSILIIEHDIIRIDIVWCD